MTLPPERISVKRRRQDEPVETLVLEPGSGQDKKRRFTDFYFQRLRHEITASQATQPSIAASTTTTTPTPSAPARDYKALGIPVVKSSKPGDEIQDFARYKAKQKTISEEKHNVPANTAGVDGSSLLRTSASSSSLQRLHASSTRRFHLTRNLNATLRASLGSGIQRSKVGLRPPLATFIEHQRMPTDDITSFHRRPPVDSIVELNDKASANVNHGSVTDESIEKRVQVNTFQKLPSSVTKNGHSIRDDPMTWDHDSDQLANELAALAFDIDPADAMEPPQVVPVAPSPVGLRQQDSEAMAIDDDNDFIFETYIRVKYDPEMLSSKSYHNGEVGVLVIDNENEDLWQRYIHEDDDDDAWDEEDEDSNAEDNPRNEYPDDEVSSDDEFGRNVYKHRQNASDDEEYGSSTEDW